MTRTIELGSTIEAANLHYTDLQIEATGVSAVECYELENVDDNGFYRTVGEMLFIPSVQRAGLCFGGDSEWTDATSAEDAISRYNADEMAN